MAVFGYVHEHQKSVRVTIPEVIGYLSLLYANYDETDQFDAENSHSILSLTKNDTMVSLNEKGSGYVTTYFKQLLSDGEHIYTIKCIKPSIMDHIGIIDSKYSKELDSSFRFNGNKVVGYSIKFNNERSYDIQSISTNKLFQGDIIKMKINLHKRKLYFQVNDENWKLLNDTIQGESFNVAMSMRKSAAETKYELIKYQRSF